jgi:hypothetical protein
VSATRMTGDTLEACGDIPASAVNDRARLRESPVHARPRRVMGNPEGATCALHEQSLATGTCARCGNYLCDLCEPGESGMCPPCRERLGVGAFPFSRESYDIGPVLGFAFERFKAHLGRLVLGSVVVLGVAMGLSLVRSTIEAVAGGADGGLVLMISMMFRIGETIVNAVLELGFIAMCLDALTGRTPELASLGRAWSKLGKLIVLNLVVGALMLVAIGVPAGAIVAIVVIADSQLAVIAGVVLGLLLLIPLLYVSLGWFYGSTEIAYDDDVDPIDALRRAWSLASGHRWPILGASVLGGLIMLGGLLLCGVGLVFAQPIAMLLQAGIYLAIRNGSGLPPPRRYTRAFDAELEANSPFDPQPFGSAPPVGQAPFGSPPSGAQAGFGAPPTAAQAAFGTSPVVEPPLGAQPSAGPRRDEEPFGAQPVPPLDEAQGASPTTTTSPSESAPIVLDPTSKPSE